jgi:hypothetical protein
MYDVRRMTGAASQRAIARFDKTGRDVASAGRRTCPAAAWFDLVGVHQGEFALRLSTLQTTMGLGRLFPRIGFGDVGVNCAAGN